MPTVIRWPGVIKPGTIHNEILRTWTFYPPFAAPAATLMW